MQVWCLQVWWRKAHWFRTQSSEKAEFTVFNDDDFENEVTLTVSLRSPKSYQFFILPRYNTLSLAGIHFSIQEISYTNPILVKI